MDLEIQDEDIVFDDDVKRADIQLFMQEEDVEKQLVKKINRIVGVRIVQLGSVLSLFMVVLVCLIYFFLMRTVNQNTLVLDTVVKRLDQ